MMNPRYRDVNKEDIPETEADVAKIKIICGEVNETKESVQDIVIEPEYLDVTVNQNLYFHFLSSLLS